MSEPAPPTDARPPSPRQVLLGLFILFQLAFLIVSNAVDAFQRAVDRMPESIKTTVNRLAPDLARQRGHGWQWCDQLETKLRRWKELTGTDQSWALFVVPSKATGFPAVLLMWDDPLPSGQSFSGATLAFDARNGFDLRADW